MKHFYIIFITAMYIIALNVLNQLYHGYLAMLNLFSVIKNCDFSKLDFED